MVELVNQFQTSDGPDHGNLACVWAVRHVVYKALGRWITRTDGTSVFAKELKACFGSSAEEGELSAGAIVISPSVSTAEGVRHGHVGLLGPPSADRVIYSNSSRHRRWEQNHTLPEWRRYYGGKGLDVLFFPLPEPSPGVGLS